MNGKDLTQGSILGNIMTFSLPITSSPRYSVVWVTLRVRCILWRWLAWSTSFWIISSSDFWDWAQWVQPLVPPCRKYHAWYAWVHIGGWRKWIVLSNIINDSYWKNQFIDSLSDEQIEVWDKSVRSLHHFLSEKDLAY